jgi:putative transposase
MRRMGMETVYRRPNISKPAPGHRIYPYLLRGLAIDWPNQVWAMDITYVPMARGFIYLVAVMDWFSRRVLSWRVSITMEAAICNTRKRSKNSERSPRPTVAMSTLSIFRSNTERSIL